MEENEVERKWFNYYGNIRNKYDVRVSINKPLIISMDTRLLSRNERNLLINEENNFFDSMKKTVKFFTIKYSCIAICGSNKISFIIEDVENFAGSIHNDKKYRVHDIISVFSQYFFEYFNNLYNRRYSFLEL